MSPEHEELLALLRFGCPFKPFEENREIADYDVPAAERVMFRAADEFERILEALGKEDPKRAALNVAAPRMFAVIAKLVETYMPPAGSNCGSLGVADVLVEACVLLVELQ
jgi:hypothetical protein